MNRNYEQTKLIMEGVELLYSMIGELTKGIKNLPGCKVTANLKMTALDIDLASSGIFDTLKVITSIYEPCDDCCESEEQDIAEADVPEQGELEEFLNKISELISSDKPVSISADIYINEDKDASDNQSEEAE